MFSCIIETKIEQWSDLECKSEMSLSFFCHIFLHLLPRSALVFFILFCFFAVNVSCFRKVSQMCVAPKQMECLGKDTWEERLIFCQLAKEFAVTSDCTTTRTLLTVNVQMSEDTKAWGNTTLEESDASRFLSNYSSWLTESFLMDKPRVWLTDP